MTADPDISALTEAAAIIQTAIDQWYSIEGGPRDMAGEPSLAQYIAAAAKLPRLLGVVEAARELVKDIGAATSDDGESVNDLLTYNELTDALATLASLEAP